MSMYICSVCENGSNSQYTMSNDDDEEQEDGDGQSGGNGHRNGKGSSRSSSQKSRCNGNNTLLLIHSSSHFSLSKTSHKLVQKLYISMAVIIQILGMAQEGQKGEVWRRVGGIAEHEFQCNKKKKNIQKKKNSSCEFLSQTFLPHPSPSYHSNYAHLLHRRP